MSDPYAKAAEDEYQPPTSGLIVRDGLAWKTLESGRHVTATPGECADEIGRLRQTLREILEQDAVSGGAETLRFLASVALSY